MLFVFGIARRGQIKFFELGWIKVVKLQVCCHYWSSDRLHLPLDFFKSFQSPNRLFQNFGEEGCQQKLFINCIFGD